MTPSTPTSASKLGRLRAGAATAIVVGAMAFGFVQVGAQAPSQTGSVGNGSETTVPVVTAANLPVGGEVLGTIPGTDNDFDTETVDAEKSASSLRPVSIVVGIVAAVSAFGVGVVIVSRTRRPGGSTRP